jgi:FKBP-type peptidyl-prolyl cis-trans isomerase 2
MVMRQAKNGDTVKVHYTGKLKDGTVFDSSVGRDPLEFTIGEKKLIETFEIGIVGMAAGENKSIKIEPQDAYGLYRHEMVAEVKRTYLPENVKPEVGLMLQIKQPEGQTLQVRISEVNDETVTLDGNHPLAGKALTFDIELLEIA